MFKLGSVCFVGKTYNILPVIDETDFIIFPVAEVEIVCRYPQFFAARLLKQSILNSVMEKSGKGGTYFSIGNTSQRTVMQ